ncbi:FAD-binding oxidoreductase [Clostridium sp. LP20]|uniref:FAD-binding oxidoreductase n=1 Tax=Clostridium sp. LP20 TaxID=3418665 RepID=UPI003EE50055
MMKYNFDGITGELVTRRSSSYNVDREIWNRSIQRFPIAIVYCFKKIDVVNAICWSRRNDVDIRVRTGGHNYEGYSIGNDILVIDISKMDNIYINEEKGIIKVDGGVSNFHIYESLGVRGYPFPGGSCLTVGVAGYAQGGGWGFSSRIFGLGCDSLKEVEIINYKGETIIANQYCNSDLFWALRGAGGGNFGIIVSMTFSLPPKINKVTLLSINYDELPLEEEVEIFDILQNMFPNLDRRINFRVSFFNSEEDGRGIYIIGLFYGREEEALEIIKPLIDINSSVKIKIEYITFLEATRKIGSIYAPYEKFKSTGGFVYKKYSKSELVRILQYIRMRPAGSVYIAVTLYGLGGAVNDKDKNSTAFYYRGCQYILGIQTVWEEDNYQEVNEEWFKEQFEIMKGFFIGSYVNFPYSDIKNYEIRYYGNHVKRLRRIKNKYDPFNIFKFQQSIKGYLED